MKKYCIALLVLLLVLCSALAMAEQKAAPCGIEGHYVGDGLDHERPKDCWVKGHFNCDGMVHTRSCEIGPHYDCDGKDHSPAPCGIDGHYSCFRQHGPTPCGIEGHCLSDGKDHNPAVCGVEGHYACDGGHTTALLSQYCPSEPQHKRCEKDAEHFCDPENGGCGVTYACKDSDEHTPCKMCGLLWCDDSLGGHYTPCGNENHRPCVYTLAGKTYSASEHPRCHLCGGGKCTGRHGGDICVPMCYHCGQPRINGESHRASCGQHYKCVSGSRDHSWCKTCNQYKCVDKVHVCQ